MCERDVQSGSKHQIIFLFASGWIRNIDIPKRVLPSHPLVDFCYRSEIKCGAILAPFIEIGEKVSSLRDDRGLGHLVHEFIADLGGGKTVYQAG